VLSAAFQQKLMIRLSPKSFFSLALLVALPLAGQVTLNPNPTRVLGHPQLALRTANPNLVEGRELYSPQALAIDRTANPPHLYVADTGNNRVLGWRDATQVVNGALADIVIGQKDKFTTFGQGPGGEINGLSVPTAVAVDSSGNVFVADSGNNRILRYPSPFNNPEAVKLPDLVIGQQSMGSRDANNDPDTHVISARTIRLASGSSAFTSDLLFDPQGNLYVSDAGNQRILRYAAADIGAGARNGPAANMVLGQLTLETPAENPTSVRDLTRLYVPVGIGMDPAGRLYVCDAAHRVLVYLPAVFSGGAATRMIGGVLNAQGGVLQPPNQQSLNSPQGVFVVGDLPYVVDSGNNRILRFTRFEDWPADLNTPPSADDVIGQGDFGGYKANRGLAAPTAAFICFQWPARAAYLAASGELFVVDSLNHRLLVLTDPATTAGSSMAYKRFFGQDFLDQKAPNLLEGREFFFGALGGGVVVDTRSTPPRLYVADTFNNRVLGFRDARNVRPGDKADLVIGQQKILRSPEVEEAFHTSLINSPEDRADRPSGKSLFHPTGLAVDTAGNLYVADTDNGRVLRFPKPFEHGSFPDADLVIGKPSFTTPLDAAADASSTNMTSPFGLALTVGGHLLVSDLTFNRVLLFQKPEGGDFTSGMAAWKVLGQPDFFSKTAGSVGNRMRGPRHISTDSSDRLFVCDTGNNRIQAFEDVTKLGPDASAAFSLTRVDQYNNLSSPQGVFVSPVTDEIWVANSGGTALYRYPRFELLVANQFMPDFGIASGATFEHPLALTVDTFSNLLVVYSTNRVGFYFPAMTPVNAADYLPRITPGMITALYPLGSTFGNQIVSAPSLPLLTELADIQVLVNDQAAPLLFVSPGQINFIMPMNAPTSGSVELQVVRKSLGQVLAVGCAAVRVGTNTDGTPRYACSGPVSMDVASPALFAGQDYSRGTGQIAALNVSPDGTYYGVNSPTNPVSRSHFVELYGTGQGFIPNGPPDGAVPGSNPLYWTPDKPRVIVNIAEVPSETVTFSGLNPYFPGLWQVNVKIPDSTPPANAIQVVIIHKGIPSIDSSNPGRIFTTIAVKQ
jgi:uncharacterized protein (TIGR03437 family)